MPHQQSKLMELWVFLAEPRARRTLCGRSDLSKHRDLGLLLLRVGIGGMFVAYGMPKLPGGPALWERVGHSSRRVRIGR